MPLKHTTETVLVIALAALMIVTGIVLATLPPLPAGVGPWVIVFAVDFLYVIALYPLLKRDRAEYEFRLLHWAPLFLTLLWLFAQLLAKQWPSTAFLGRWLTLGSSGLLVTVFFLLLAGFCLRVIRRRVPRLAVLAALFLPFVALSVASERTLHWDRQIAATLWAWTGASQSQSSRAASAGRSSSSIRVVASLSSPLSSYRSSQAPPTPNPSHLPTSGPAAEVLGSVLVAGYCAMLHRRAKKRTA